MKNHLLQIAKTCHEAHNVICKLHNQEVISWEDKSAEHKRTVQDSILKILDGSIVNAEIAHINFVAMKISDGWSFDEIYSVELKTNPRLRNYQDLPQADIMKAEMFFAIVKSFMK